MRKPKDDLEGNLPPERAAAQVRREAEFISLIGLPPAVPSPAVPSKAAPAPETGPARRARESRKPER